MAAEPTKRRVGRPGLYEDPDKFRARCEAYFEQLIFEDDGRTPRKDATAPTIARLALFVGFNHVQTFYEQVERGDELSAVAR